MTLATCFNVEDLRLDSSCITVSGLVAVAHFLDTESCNSILTKLGATAPYCYTAINTDVSRRDGWGGVEHPAATPIGNDQWAVRWLSDLGGGYSFGSIRPSLR